MIFKQFIASLSAAGGCFSFGNGMGWSLPASWRPRLADDDDRYFEMSSNELSWATKVLTIGCVISCLPIGILTNKFGRKLTMMSLFVPLVIGWALVAWAQNFRMLVIERFIIGLAGGSFSVSVPKYSVEITENEIRGRVGSLAGVLMLSGILFVHIVGAFASLFWTNIICTIIPLVFGVTFIFMPESPTYLVKEKLVYEARKSFIWLRGNSYDPQAEIDELVAETEKREEVKSSVLQIIEKRATDVFPAAESEWNDRYL